MWSFAPLIREYMDGICASGLWEAILGKNRFGFDKVCTYAPAYKSSEFEEIAQLSTHIIFNSPSQYRRFALVCKEAQSSVGLRINPLHSEGIEDKYDPCSPSSRLGYPIDMVKREELEVINGIHMHTLCEQDFPPLKRTWKRVEEYMSEWNVDFEWINLGGGHLLTSPKYQRLELIEFLKDLSQQTGAQIYLEPGESVALDTGILVGEILDVQDRETPTAILDISATCHMPDVLEAPYRPALLNEALEGVSVQLGGPSCLTGDNIGNYRFEKLPQPGHRVAFLDQAHYSMVKTNTFNGIPLPSIAIWNSETDELKVVREFDYHDFETRLS